LKNLAICQVNSPQASIADSLRLQGFLWWGLGVKSGALLGSHLESAKFSVMFRHFETTQSRFLILERRDPGCTCHAEQKRNSLARSSADFVARAVMCATSSFADGPRNAARMRNGSNTWHE